MGNMPKLPLAAHLFEGDFGGGPVLARRVRRPLQRVLGDLRGRLPAGVLDDGLDLREGRKEGG